MRKEFGDNCSLLAGPPQFVADLDGDGVEDLVIAARCKNPLADQAEYGFRVVDPYNSFLGYGDVKVTSTFALSLIHICGRTLPKTAAQWLSSCLRCEGFP